MVAAVLLVVVLVAWASTIGPGDLFRGEGIGPLDVPSESAGAEPEAVAPPESDGDDEVEDIEVHTWVRVVMWVINVAFLVLLVLLFARYVVRPLTRLARARLHRTAAAPEPAYVALEPPQAVARALLGDAGEQRRLLAGTGTPRNAVVECWHRFETAAAAAGLARRPWETSSEYTMRVLDLVDADQPAVSRLAALYREARFSEHELTEADRDAALAALDRIHRTIGIPA